MAPLRRPLVAATMVTRPARPEIYYSLKAPPRRLLVSVVTMRPLCTVLAGAGADGVAEGAAATQRQTPSNSPVHGEPDAEAIGPAGGLVVDAPPAPSARGPVFEVHDSPPPATSASAEAPSAADAPLAGTNKKKRSWAFNEEFVASSAPRPVWQDSSLGHQLTDMDQLLGQLSQARGSEYA